MKTFHLVRVESDCFSSQSSYQVCPTAGPNICLILAAAAGALTVPDSFAAAGAGAPKLPGSLVAAAPTLPGSFAAAAAVKTLTIPGRHAEAVLPTTILFSCGVFDNYF